APDSHRLDRASARRGRGRISKEGDRFPRGNGGAWPLQQTVSRLRHAGAAHRLRGERNELLRAMPDGRPAAGRSSVVAAASRRLAEVDRRVVGCQLPVASCRLPVASCRFFWELATGNREPFSNFPKLLASTAIEMHGVAPALGL